MSSINVIPRKITWTKKMFLVIAYSAGFSGFTLLLLVINVAGLSYASRQYTIPYRVAFLAFSVLFLLYGISKRFFANFGLLWIPLLTFWLLYLLRVAIDGYIAPVPLHQPPMEYVQKAVGIAFIPMFIFLMRLGPRENRVAFRAFWLVHIGYLFILVLFYNKFFKEPYRFLRIQAVDISTFISPILLSYIGVITAVISFQLIFKEISLKKNLYHLSLIMIFIGGIFFTLYGGTRSALLTLVIVCILIIYKSSLTPNAKIKAFSLGVLFLIIGVLLYPIMERAGAFTVKRFNLLRERISTSDPMAGGGRFEIYRRSIVQIIEFPVFGSSLEVKDIQAYPHNHILEAFMTTGILGGISFLILVCTTIRRCLAIFKYRKYYGWIACLFLVFFIRGLFSSSIIEPMLWYSMLCVLAVPLETPGKSIMFWLRH